MYLTQKNPDKYWIIDLESDGLDPSVIWLVVVKNLQSGEVRSFYDKETFNVWHKSDHVYVGHNAISFDLPVINRLWGSGIDLFRCADTLVLSYLYNPAMEVPPGLQEKNVGLPKRDRKGAFSLDAWGYRLKYPKGEFSDWSKYSPEMEVYCRNDVELTYKVYKALSRRMGEMGFSELSCEIEHKVRVVIDEQERTGVWFDREGATRFSEFLKREQARLAVEIHRLFPPSRTEVKRYTFRRTKDGSPFASYERHLSKYDDVVDNQDGTYSCYNMVEFNLGSPDQRIEKLLELGWEPSAWTPTGKPKVDEDALLAFSRASEDGPRKNALVALSEWIVIQGRLSMIAGNPKTGSKGWLGNVRDHGGGNTRIHGRLRTCAATTRRMIHSDPNTANVPSAHKAKYGKECRSFWGVEPGRGLVLVGYDASGLETAGLCHYLNNPRATEILLRPKPEDIHSANARRLTEALGWACDREWVAKTDWYAWLYGAYPKKLGNIAGASKHGMKEETAGEIVIDTFFRNVPGLKKLIEEVQYEFRHNRGLLATIDGGFVRCPSANAALNYRIQSAGAIVMKLTSVMLRDEAKKIGLDFNKVLDIHDEGQLECAEGDAEQLGRLAVDCISRAGVRLAFNVPLTGDYKIGKSWDETH